MALLRSLGSKKDRRRSERVRCRLRCTLRRGRKWLPARVLDVSEEGLCVLSPIRLETKQKVQLRIDVPRRGPVDVEAVAWHQRRVRSGTSQGKAWSIGMMISKAGDGFRALLPDQGLGSDADAARAVLAQMAEAAGTGASQERADPDLALEEDGLDPEQLDALDLELLAADEMLPPLATRAAPRDGDETICIYRVRVQAKSGPRTKTLTLGAVSAAEAEMLAHTELEGDWKVLEVTRA